MDNMYYVTLEDGTQQPVEIWESDDTYTEILSWLVPGDIILGMKISNTELSNAGVASVTQSSGFPWWGSRTSTSQWGTTQWWWNNNGPM
jgi:hypothetical protein